MRSGLLGIAAIGLIWLGADMALRPAVAGPIKGNCCKAKTNPPDQPPDASDIYHNQAPKPPHYDRKNVFILQWAWINPPGARKCATWDGTKWIVKDNYCIDGVARCEKWYCPKLAPPSLRWHDDDELDACHIPGQPL